VPSRRLLCPGEWLRGTRSFSGLSRRTGLHGRSPGSGCGTGTPPVQLARIGQGDKLEWATCRQVSAAGGRRTGTLASMGCCPADGLADQVWFRHSPSVPAGALAIGGGWPGPKLVGLRMVPLAVAWRRAWRIAGCLARGSGRADGASKALEGVRAEATDAVHLPCKAILFGSVFRLVWLLPVTCRNSEWLKPSTPISIGPSGLNNLPLDLGRPPTARHLSAGRPARRIFNMLSSHRQWAGRGPRELSAANQRRALSVHRTRQIRQCCGAGSDQASAEPCRSRMACSAWAAAKVCGFGRADCTAGC